MSRQRTLLGLVAIIAAAVGWWVGTTTADSPTAETTVTVTATVSEPGGTTTLPTLPDVSATDPETGQPWIALDELPPEARDTLELIESDGPFPYDRDGAVFQNREGLLPDEDSGYYREYTVVTRASGDRGARRIVAGRSGERYYTDDHYDSFRRIGS